jgi:hypothetical protein
MRLVFFMRSMKHSTETHQHSNCFIFYFPLVEFTGVTPCRGTGFFGAMQRELEKKTRTLPSIISTKSRSINPFLSYSGYYFTEPTGTEDRQFHGGTIGFEYLLPRHITHRLDNG